MIHVDNVSHAFGQLHALDGVSFSIAPGEIVGLVGPNGAGKSTVLRAVATLLRPNINGRIAVGGHDTQNAPNKVRAELGYLPERANLYPELCAWEYLDFFAETVSRSRRDRERIVNAALEHVGLRDRRNHLTRELSKGLQQRLALAATTLHTPKALVLDEPTDGLDPSSRAQLLTDIRQVAATGCAVLLSSHVLEEVEQVASRVVILVNGRVSREDTSKGRVFPLQFRGDVDTARALLEAHPDVVSVDLVESDGSTTYRSIDRYSRVFITLSPAACDVGDIASALIAQGFRLTELVEERATLRERFARATHGGHS